MTTCEKCGKEFKKKYQKQRFCSGACAGNTRAVIHALVCSYCGVAFEKKIPPSMSSAKERFCCLEHAQRHRRKMRATATNCVRCKADLSPKDLVRIGQDRAKWRKAGKGEPPHLCLGCRAEERQAKAEKAAIKNAARKHRRKKACVICGEMMFTLSNRPVCSKRCLHKRMYFDELSSPSARLNRRMSNAIGKTLRGEKAGRRWESLVGYTLEDLFMHIESKFACGMTWDNYGRNGWHIDHILPLSRFNITCAEDPDFKRAWALSNLQPMWEAENIRKSNKIEKPFQPSLAIGA